MDWIHCNVCFKRPSSSNRMCLSMTTCGRILCGDCLGQNPCVRNQCSSCCQRNYSLTSLSGNLPEKVQEHFKDPFEHHLKKFMVVQQYQADHRKHLQKHYDSLEQKLEVLDKKYKQLCTSHDSLLEEKKQDKQTINKLLHEVDQLRNTNNKLHEQLSARTRIPEAASLMNQDHKRRTPVNEPIQQQNIIANRQFDKPLQSYSLQGSKRSSLDSNSSSFIKKFHIGNVRSETTRMMNPPQFAKATPAIFHATPALFTPVQANRQPGSLISKSVFARPLSVPNRMIPAGIDCRMVLNQSNMQQPESQFSISKVLPFLQKAAENAMTPERQ